LPEGLLGSARVEQHGPLSLARFLGMACQNDRVAFPARLQPVARGRVPDRPICVGEQAMGGIAHEGVPKTPLDLTRKAARSPALDELLILQLGPAIRGELDLRQA
jgi:hypothetical protein